MACCLLLAGSAWGTTLVTDGFNTASCPVGWATEIVTNTGSPEAAITFVASSSEPTATPYEGARFLKFNYCSPGSQARLKQTNSFSTVGCDAPVSVRFAWHRDTGFPSATNEGVTVQWSTNGAAWTSETFFPRVVAASNGWRRAQVNLPVGALGQPAVFLAFLFRSEYGNNCYLDDLSVADVSDVEPPDGPAAGGTAVLIGWPLLGSGSDITNVTVCGVSAVIQEQSTARVTVVTAPAAFGTGDIVVRSVSRGATVLTNAFTYRPTGTICGAFLGWTNAPPLPAPRGFAAGAAGADGCVYVAGGSTNLADAQSSVYRLNLAGGAQVWAAVSNLPAPRQSLAVAAAGRYLFALGGEHNGVTTNTVYRYDTSQPASGWTSVSNLPAVRKKLAAVSANGRLYALGGANAGGTAQASVYAYDPLQPQQGWSSVSNLPGSRLGLAAASFGGRLYALGGSDAAGVFQSAVFEYNPLQPARGWTSVSNMPAPRYGLAAVSQNGRLYALGGRYADWESSVLTLDPTQPSAGWAAVANLVTGNITHVAAALDTNIVVAGGWSGYQALDTVQQARFAPGVAPAEGRLSGYVSVVISGANLGRGDVTNVTLCGVPVAGIMSQSSTRVEVIAAASAVAGIGPVAVFSRSHGQTVASNAFTYTLAAPTILPPTDVTAGGFTVNWKAVSGVTNYCVDVALDGGFTAYLSGYRDRRLGAVNSLSVTGTSAGAVCYCRVRSELLGVFSDNSSTEVAYIPGLSVTNGPGRGGGLLTINRSGLGSYGDITNVTVCGLVAEIVSQTADSVTVRVPGVYMGAGDVAVASASRGLNVFTNGYTYAVPGYLHGDLLGWTNSTPFSFGRSATGLVAADGKLYSLGGIAELGGVIQCFDTAQVFDPVRPELGWVAVSKMPAGRAYVAATGVGSRIFVIGGYSMSGVHSNVFVFDATQPQAGWAEAPPLPAACLGASACGVNGRVYVIGGEDESGSRSSAVFSYDPDRPELGWSAASPLPSGRSLLASVGLHGRLYAMGGNIGGAPAAEMLVYDPHRPGQGWQSLSNLPVALEGPAAAAANGRIFVAGGCGGALGGAAYSYDPAQPGLGWRSEQALPSARFYAAAAALYDRLYVAGGESEGQACTQVLFAAFGPSATPSEVALSGGEQVVLRGSHLGSGADVTAATLCGVPASLLSQSPTQVVVSAGSSTTPGWGAAVVCSASAGATAASNAVAYRPATPASLSASQVTVNSFLASWAPVPYATNYLLDVASAADFSAGALVQSGLSAGSGTTCTVSGLAAGGSYFCRVRAVAGALQSFCSEPLGVTVAAGTLSASSGPAAGGQDVVVSGLGLGGGADITNATVCGVRAVVLAQGANSLTLRTGAGGDGCGDVRVYSASRGPSLLTNAYTYLEPGVICDAQLSWAGVSNMPAPRARHAAAVLGDSCYVMGGMLDWGETSSVLQYDQTRPQLGWTPAAALPAPRFEMAAAALNGRLYALGGLGYPGPHASVFSYDPAEPARGWTNAPSLPVPCYGLAAAAVAGRLYALGGYTGGVVSAAAYCYDPAEPERGWREICGLPAARSGLAAVGFGGKLYAIGGSDQHGFMSSAVYAYDPTAPDSGWVSVSNLPAARVFLAAAACAGRVHAVGGNDPDYGWPTSSVCAFDPSRPSGGWANPGNLPAARERLAVAGAGSRLFAVGGYWRAGYGSLVATDSAWLGDYWGGVEPSAGPLSGGEPVTISGLYLGSGSDITNVTLCGVSASIVSQSSTQVVVLAASSAVAGIGPVAVCSASRGVTTKSSAYGYRPAAPTPLAASGVASGGFDANWMALPLVASNYDVNVSSAEDFSVAVGGYEARRVMWSATCPVRGLKADTLYWYRVRYQLTDGLYSDWSSGVCARTAAVSLSASHGPAAGGHVLTISGALLGSGSDIVWVTVCGQSAVLLEQTATSVTLRLAAGWQPGTADGCGDVVVFSASRGSTTLPDSYTYGPRGYICGPFAGWAAVSNLPAARADAAAFVRGGQAFVAGGTDGSRAQAEGWSLFTGDGLLYGWTGFALPAPRSGAAAVSCGLFDYVAGGYEADGAASAAVMRSDSVTGAWTNLPALPAPRAGWAAAAVAGKVYALGGRDASGQPRAEVFRYDSARPGDGWSAVSNLPAPRAELAAASVGGRIYALGGTDGASPQRTVFCYDPAAASLGWTAAASLPTGLVALAAGACQGRLYAAGGFDSGSNACPSFFLFDPQQPAQGWVVGTNLPQARARAASAGSDEGVLVAAGSDGTSLRAECVLGSYGSGVFPARSGWTNQPLVTLLGVGLGQGDVTNVTLCGLAAEIVSDLSPSQVVVRAAAATNSLFGDVVVESAGVGPTVAFGAFTYSVDAPLGLTVSDASANGFLAAWEAVTNASGYRLEVAADSAFSSQGASYRSLSLSGLSARVTGLLPSTLYYSRVRAVHAGVDGESASAVAIATAPAAVAPATGPAAGGRVVTVTALGLGEGSDVTNVTVCGAAAAILDQSADWVTVRTGPAAPGTGDVMVRSSSRGETTLLGAFIVNPPGRIIGGLEWSAAPALPSNRVGLALASAGGQVLAFGGLTLLPVPQAHVQAWRFNPAQPSQGWVAVSNLPAPRAFLEGAAADGKVYALGGTTAGGDVSGSVWRYDPAQPAAGWAAQAELPDLRTGFAMAAVSNRLYAIGGRRLSTGDPSLSGSVFHYEVSQPLQGWSSGVALPAGLESAGAASQDGVLYVVGGAGVDGQVTNVYACVPERPGAGWTPLAGLPAAREGLAAVSVEGRILALGGYDGAAACSDVYQYDPDQPSWGWRSATRLPEPIASVAAAAAGALVFVTGGGTNVFRGAFASGVSPSAGPLAGGAIVCISGERLGDGSDITNVTLCGVSAAMIVSQSATQVVVAAASSPGAVTGAVTVCSSSFGVAVRSNAYAYVLMPRLLAAAGPGGTIMPSGNVYVAYGATTGFAVTAASYYHVKALLTNGVPAGFKGATNVFLTWPAVVADGTVEALFAANVVTNSVPEWWLRHYYPAVSDLTAAALSDTDGDSLPAWGEYHARTDPTNRLSVLAFTAIDNAGTERVVAWQSASDCVYRVYAATNLLTGFGTLWKSNVLATPPLNVETDRTESLGRTRFFRVELEMPPAEEP